MPLDMNMKDEEEDPSLDGEASKMAIAEIMALLQQARGQRLRSKLPKPAEPAPDASAPAGDDSDVLAQLAEMLGAEDPEKAVC